MSIIRADSIKNRGGNGAPTATNGLIVTGVCTATDFSGQAGAAADFPNGLTGTTGTFSGNLGVGGVLTYEDVTNIDSVGVITARDGLRVTGIATATEYEVVNAGNTPIFRFRGSSNNEIGKIDADAISGTTSQLRLYTENGGNIGERLRIGPAGQLGIGGANYGSSGQVLTSQGSGSAIQWATVSTPLVAYKAKESVFQRYSFSNNSWSEIKSNFRITHTPAATGNTIIMHTQIYHTTENSSYGGFANVTDQGSGSDEAMIGESNTSNAVQKGTVLSSTYHNEMIRNTNGGNMWMGTHLWGYHVTENTNAHTFKLFGRMGNGTRYVGDNQMGQLMQIWEYQGNVMQ